MMGWIRFTLTAIFMLVGLFILLTGVVAQFRFKYALNRMHAASMGDSLGLLFILISVCISCQDIWMILKCVLVILFLWITSPTGAHLIARLEMTLNKQPEAEMEIRKP